MTKALIDGDVLCYAIGSLTNDHPFVKDDEGRSVDIPMPIDYIEQVTEDRLLEIADNAECSEYEVHISGSSNFREQVATTFPYKGHRKDTTKPVHHGTVKAFLANLDNTVVAENREADDTLAENQTKDTVICTVDKDLLMVEGKHYNWNKPEQGVIFVTKEEGLAWFFKQLLTGDWSTDRILGCAKLEDRVRKATGVQYQARKGIGDKKADTLLAEGYDLRHKLQIVAEQYQEMFDGEWEDKLNEMGRLLWMGGSEDNLWTYSDFVKELEDYEEESNRR